MVELEDTQGLGPCGSNALEVQILFRPLSWLWWMIDKISIMNRARIQKRHARDILVEKTAKELFEKHKDNPIFLSGIVLYWAEGTRLNKNYRKYQLSFTNSDVNLVKFYCNFLQKYFNCAMFAHTHRQCWVSQVNTEPVAQTWAQAKKAIIEDKNT